jgi:predicted Zn-dependent protease
VSLFLLATLGADGSSFLQDFIGNTASITNLAFSRKQESDSDDIASTLLIEFYGHASGAAEFFQYIQSEGSVLDEIPNFLSTHPSTDNRISNLIEIEKNNSGVKKELPTFLKSYMESN